MGATTEEKKSNGIGAHSERRDRERSVTFARKGIVTFGAVSLLLIFFVGETSLQKLMLIQNWSVQRLSTRYCTCREVTEESPEYLQYSFDLSTSLGQHLKSSITNSSSYTHLAPGKNLLSSPTVQEAYKNKITHVSNLTSSGDYMPSILEFKTAIEPNRNVLQYGLTGVRNVCMRPEGAIVMVGMSEEEILAQVGEVPALHQEWFSTYNCSQDWGCVGYENIAKLENSDISRVTWVAGTTTHIVPYLGNVFHHFADRVWPHIAGFQYPLNKTSPHPIHHFLVHRLSTWLLQAGHNMDRNTLMYQIRILARLGPEADFLDLDALLNQDGQQQHPPLVCFERLVLACTTCDRVSDKLGHNITKPALLRYREAAFSFFRMSEPVVPLPPRPLRVTFYGRGDTSRRKVTNAAEVVEHLRSSSRKNPPFEVTFVDELLAAGEYNQSLPEVISLFSQTDIFITVHGANTWAALFMPKHAAVIEIYGPCGPSTWIGIIVDALDLKHDVWSNPWAEAVASTRAGNTTLCQSALETPDFTLDLEKLDVAMHGLALPLASSGFADRIPRHWLYNWSY